MKISEVMNKAFAVEPDISIRKAAKIMSDKRLGSLIVLQGEKIAGILTDSDVVKNVSELGRKISGVMSKGVVTINSDDSIDNAALIMAKHKIKRLPVIEKGKLVGIITATDIIANSDTLNEDFLFD